MSARNYWVTLGILIFLACPTLAIINVTPVSVGESYIVWEWNSGLDLTDMYIDGNVMCGYNTTDNMYVIAGLNPDEQHNISVYTLTDWGTNTTRTLEGSGNAAYILESAEEVPIPLYIPLAAVLSLVVIKRRKHE